MVMSAMLQRNAHLLIRYRPPVPFVNAIHKECFWNLLVLQAGTMKTFAAIEDESTMKRISIVMLLLAASARPQSAKTGAARDAFRRVAERATLAILRSDRDKDETSLDAEKAIDEVRIEAETPAEESIIHVLVQFEMAVFSNNSTRKLLKSQFELDTTVAKTDLGIRDAALINLKSTIPDMEEMQKREVACSDAIVEMLRHKLSTDIPTCSHVVLEKGELKTKVTDYSTAER